MKSNKFITYLILFGVLTLSSFSAKAYRISVCIEILSHSGSGDYSQVDRNVTDVLDHTGAIKHRYVSIGCSGNGSNSCPSAMYLPSEPPLEVTNLPQSVINECDALIAQATININQGVPSNEGTKHMQVTFDDGTIRDFIIYYDWITTEAGTGTINIKVDSL